MTDDLISRQAAIDALADMHCKSDEDGYVWIIRSDAWARIDALPSSQTVIVRNDGGYFGTTWNEVTPSAQPERKKGKWIKKKGSLWSLATCSVCGELSVEGDKPFCPNCGAQMIGDKENDERI